MLQKPAISEQILAAALARDFGVVAGLIDFLPLGADFNTAVYRVTDDDCRSYFLKLRRGSFDDTPLILARYLHDQGIAATIPLLYARDGRLWGELKEYKTLLYPYIGGQDAYERRLTTAHWREFGAALARIHALTLPETLSARIRREEYSPQYRRVVAHVLEKAGDLQPVDAIAAELLAFLAIKRAEIADLIGRADSLAGQLRERPLPVVLCHADLHAGNLHLAGSRLYIVDWDEPILAPRERDLMFVGGALLASGLTPQLEEERFYPAYGRVSTDRQALAYYRIERIIQDIAAYCDQLLPSAAGGSDRAQSLLYLTSNFQPNSSIAAALRTRD